MKLKYKSNLIQKQLPWLACTCALSLAWCANALTITSGPVLTTSTNAPLAAGLQLTTDDSSRVSVSVNNGTETWGRDFYDYSTNHLVPLLGFNPDQTNQITVTVHDRSGNAVTGSQPLEFVTGSLPSRFPPFTVLKSEPEKMEPGYTLFIVQNVNQTPNYLAAVDNSGQVAWVGGAGIPLQFDVRQLPNGDLFIPEVTNFIEVNMLGDVVHNWVVPDGLSINIHDGVPTDHNTILYLNDAGRTVTNLPSSVTNPSAPPFPTASVDYQRIVEISATNSALLNIWSPIDQLDPTRIDYHAFQFNVAGLGWDIYHANAVIEDPRDNSLVMSLRDQDCVVKISRDTGQLKWILGPHDNWGPQWQPYLLTPVGSPFEWNYEQHAPQLTPWGTLLVYDDGDFKALPFDPPINITNNYSRSVEFKIDERKMEVSQVWDYGRTNSDRIYTDQVGNTDWLPKKKNVLVTFGYVDFVNGVHPNTNIIAATSVRIQEVTYQPIPEKVFDLQFFDPSNTSRSYLGNQVYRSHRIPDLYAVVTAGERVADLITMTGNAESRFKSAMVEGLGGALTLIGQQDLRGAVNHLRSFQTMARIAHLDSDTEEQCLNQSQGIIDALSAGGDRYPTELLTGLFPNFSPTHAAADLMDQVGQIGSCRQTGMVGELSSAVVHMGLNEPGAAIHSLRQFQGQLARERLGPNLTDQFSFQAQQIIKALDQGADITHCHLNVVTQGGKPCIEFSGIPTRTYKVEASTDMVHWQMIGTAQETSDGSFQFQDPQSDQFQSRYYRIVEN